MDRYPIIADAMKPTIRVGICIVKVGDLIKSTNATAPAPSITGTDIKNEKRAADGLSRLRIIPPVMVDPDREMPGKRDITWNNPIINPSIQLIVSIERLRFPTRSANTNKAAVPSRNKPAASGLPKARSTRSLNRTPAITAGMVAKIKIPA